MNSRAFSISPASKNREAVLDRFIRFWETSDEAYFEYTLGPHARSALKVLRKRKPLAETRSALRSAKKAGVIGVAFRFEGADAWARPGETLDASDTPGTRVPLPANPSIRVLFKDRAGADCGSDRIDFVATTAGGTQTYSIDNADIENLLSVLTRCAAVK